MTSEPNPAFSIARILVCVAESTASDQPIRAAIRLAEKTRARIDLLHVVEPIRAHSLRLDAVTGADVSKRNADTVAARIRTHLAREFGSLKAPDGPIQEKLEVVLGSPARVVLERSKHYDVIFLGESGRRKQLDMGGLARSLFARCETPLWIQVDPPREIRRILAPIDLSSKSLEVLHRAVALAGTSGASVTALHCFVAPEIFADAEAGIPIPAQTYTLDSIRQAEERDYAAAMQQFDWRGVSHDTEFAQDDAARRILAIQDRYDLIVLGTHGHSALVASVLGSVAWRVLRMAHTGILLVRTRGGFALQGE